MQSTMALVPQSNVISIAELSDKAVFCVAPQWKGPKHQKAPLFCLKTHRSSGCEHSKSKFIFTSVQQPNTQLKSKPTLNPNLAVLPSVSSRKLPDPRMLSENGKKPILTKQASRTGNRSLCFLLEMRKKKVWWFLTLRIQHFAAMRAGEVYHLLPYIFLIWLMLAFLTVALLLKLGHHLVKYSRTASW